MSTRHTDDELGALREAWTKEQAALASELVFEDAEDLSFTAKPPKDGENKNTGADYAIPTVHTESISEIQVEGLKYVGGLDISYVDDPPTDGEPDAYATIVVLSFPKLEVLHEVTKPIHLTTPYIPSFLAYREAPTYLLLLEYLREQLRSESKEDEFPQLLLVDGNGRLHVREAGSACVVGLKSGIPTIGVAKNYHPPHAGSAEGEEGRPGTEWRNTQAGMRAIAQKSFTVPGSWFGLFRQSDVAASAAKGTYIGAALLQRGQAKNPIFVSPGHKISLLSAIRLTLALSQTRIPEPVRKADFLSREAVRTGGANLG